MYFHTIFIPVCIPWQCILASGGKQKEDGAAGHKDGWASDKAMMQQVLLQQIREYNEHRSTGMDVCF